MIAVVIGIATYKRPIMLRETLMALVSIDMPQGIAIAVADNSPLGEGVAVVDRLLSKGYPHPLTAINVPERGIPQARNMLVATAQQAGAEWVAFLDDDQVPERAWLMALLRKARETGADVVGSAVRSRFKDETPEWLRQVKLLRSDDRLDGPVEMVNSTGGVLVSLRALERLAPPYFDLDFALTGGSDSDLFRRMDRAGATFARASGSVVNEVYPASRANVRWVLQRAFRIGASDMRIMRKQDWRAGTIALEAFRIAAAPPVVLVQLVLGIGQPGKQVDALCRLARAGGKVKSLLGGRHDEYARTHGH